MKDNDFDLFSKMIRSFILIGNILVVVIWTIIIIIDIDLDIC